MEEDLQYEKKNFKHQSSVPAFTKTGREWASAAFKNERRKGTNAETLTAYLLRFKCVKKLR